jgi:hypothetical protein
LSDTSGPRRRNAVGALPIFPTARTE